jgi:hypothetical protein
MMPNLSDRLDISSSRVASIFPLMVPTDTSTPHRAGLVCVGLRASCVPWVHFLGNHWTVVDGECAEAQAYIDAAIHGQRES